MSVKELKKQLMAAIAMVLVAAIALASATYAWFVNNSQVTAKSATATATTSKLLLISCDDSNYGTSTDLGITLDALNPVSAGENLIKTGKFYKVASWANGAADSTSNPYGVLATTYVEANGTQGTANGTQGKTTTGDYAYQTIYLKSDVPGAVIYFDDTTTEISASVSVAVDSTTYTVKSTYKAGEITSKVLSGSETVEVTGDSITAAKTQTTNALGALRIALVPYTGYSSSSAGNAGDPVVLTNSTTDATSGSYYNTDSNTDSDGVAQNISTRQVVKEITTGTNKATLETDPAVAISGYTATVNTSTGAVTAGTNALTTLTNANTAYKYIAYVYLEGCDKDCVSTIAGNVTYDVQLGFTQSTTSSSN